MSFLLFRFFVFLLGILPSPLLCPFFLVIERLNSNQPLYLSTLAN